MPQYDNSNKGAGWIKTSKKGIKYISCKVNVNGKDMSMSIFKNTKKSSPKQPDYNIIVSELKTYAPQQVADNLGFGDENQMDETPF